ncbi:MAG: polysaccharide biosynthesis tyrosine autokinase [Actinobacteria bacterium]|nr:polysaccharide biosynthesis tyrosine autokinase [Actinomycetota bacterium]
MSIPQNPTASPALSARGLMLSRPGLAVPDQSASITPADIWRIIRKRLLLIFITIMIVNAVGIPLNLAWRRWWPSWPGVALLEVVYPVVPEALATRQAAQPNRVEIFQRSEAQVLQSRQYAQKLLADPQIRRTKWYLKSEVDALARFERTLSVSPLRNSAVIRVSFQTRDPEEAPRIVNTLVDIYLADRKKSATEGLVQQLTTLRSQHAKLQTELRNINANIARFIKTENIPVVRVMNTEIEAELSRLVLARGELEMANEAAKAGLETMRQQVPETWVPGSMQAYRIDNDPSVRTLRSYLLDLEERREVQSKRLGPDHLFIQRLEESIRVANRDLQDKLAEIRLQVFAETLQDYENAVSANEQTLAQIQAGIDKAHEKQNELNPKILDYQGRQDERDALVRYIGVVENKINNVSATIEQQKGNISSQVVRLSMATPAPTRSSPKLRVNIPATMFLSIFMAVGLAFLLEFLDKSVRSSQDVRRHTELTLLGSIPALQDDASSPADMYSVVMQAPRSLMAEAFRQIRTNLLFYCSRDDARSILVTSPSPEDGRTCTAINLSASMALAGLKVILIDANFCKPALNRIFTNLPDVGLADLLLGKVSMDQVIVDSPVPGLSIMGNGQAPAEHTELLGGDVMRGVIAKLRERFDQVILDGPPALLTAHALSIAGQVDGIIFVARAGKNSRGELNRMREEIIRLNSHIHGVVLNGVQATSGGYLRKNYQQFYDYHYAESSPGTQMLGNDQSQQPTPPQTG